MRVCVSCDFEKMNLIISFSLFEKELGKPHIGISLLGYPKKSFLPMTVNKIDSLPMLHHAYALPLLQVW